MHRTALDMLVIHCSQDVPKCVLQCSVHPIMCTKCTNVYVYKGAAKCVKVCEPLAKCILQCAKVCQCEAKCSLQWIKVNQSVPKCTKCVPVRVSCSVHPIMRHYFRCWFEVTGVTITGFSTEAPDDECGCAPSSSLCFELPEKQTIATWPQLWLWWSSWSWTLTDLTTVSLPCADSRFVF